MKCNCILKGGYLSQNTLSYEDKTYENDTNNKKSKVHNVNIMYENDESDFDNTADLFIFLYFWKIFLLCLR